jgi:hypothetical protein
MKSEKWGEGVRSRRRLRKYFDFVFLFAAVISPPNKTDSAY